MVLKRALVVLLILGIISAEIVPFAGEVQACPISIQNMMMYALALTNYKRAQEMAEKVNKMLEESEKESLTDEQKERLEEARGIITDGENAIGKGEDCLGKCNINANNFFLKALRYFITAEYILNNLPPHKK